MLGSLIKTTMIGAAAALAIGVAAPAEAALVTYTFTGAVTTKSGIFSSVPLGTNFVGTIIYDDSVVDTDPAADVGFYPQPVGTLLSIDIDPATLGGPLVTVVIGNRPNEDGFGFVALVQPTTTLGIALVLLDLDGTVSSSDALPSTLPDLAQFEDAAIVVGTTSASTIQGSFGGPLRTLTRVADVPAPSAAALLLAGLLGIGATRRIRSV